MWIKSGRCRALNLLVSFYCRRLHQAIESQIPWMPSVMLPVRRQAVIAGVHESALRRTNELVKRIRRAHAPTPALTTLISSPSEASQAKAQLHYVCTRVIIDFITCPPAVAPDSTTLLRSSLCLSNNNVGW